MIQLYAAVILLSGHVFCQNIIKGPYLVEPGDTEIRIRWETDRAVTCKVRFGRDSRLEQEAPAVLRGEKHNSYLYESELKNLNPGTEYSYRVFAGEVSSAEIIFHTFETGTDRFQFVAMGDSRSNPDIFKQVIENVHMKDPDLIISMGDLVANGGTWSEWDNFYFSVAGSVINHIPLVSTLGDHEGSGDDGELFRYYLRTDQTTEKQWFSFDYGNAHFISLDYRHPENQEMINWFINDIKSSSAKWKFVYMHRPCYNLGGHRSAWGRGIWPDLFRKYQVDIVFAGHSHHYERFFPLRPESDPGGWPVTYMTTGGAGAGLYDITRNPYLAQTESVNHYVYFEISGDTLKASAIRNDNSLLDSFVMIKTDGYYDQNYLALTRAQEDLDVLTMFTRAVSLSIRTLPLDDHPARVEINLKSSVAQNVPFTVTLSAESAKQYEMQTVSGVLDGFESLNLPVNILSKTSMTISRWGDIEPKIRLAVDFRLGGQSYHIEGGSLEYWPGEDY